MNSGSNIAAGISQSSRIAAGTSILFAALMAYSQPAFAQSLAPSQLPSGIANSALSAPSAISDLASKFLRDTANQAKASQFAPGANNPGGGGADIADGISAAPRYRSWLEGYGTRSQTGAQNQFTGDMRRSYGGIAGLGMTLSPGLSVGASVDQGRTKIDISVLPQSSRIDLTQFGANVVYETGPWTFTAAGIHGIGHIRARRSDAGGEIAASYDASLWGAIGEVSYYWSSGQWRIVPKIGIDWTRISVDPFVESGGAVPITATRQNTERVRAFAGAEAGYYWMAGTTLYDLSVYGRVVDILSQDVDSVFATANVAGYSPRTIAGIVDSRFEFDTGASATMKISDNLRFYLIYDGRFRDGFSAHGGTLGVELRW
jgi:uncharacterized protein with beta-barrel porin domain